MKPNALSNLTLLLAVIVAALTASCRTTQFSDVRVLVVDGVRSEPLADSEYEYKGWWFSRRQYYRSAGDGVLMADILADEFTEFPGAQVHSREDWRMYQAGKERLLRRGYPDLTAEQRRDVLAKQDPIDYGRSVGADYVLRPVIDESFLTTNKVFLWWYSKLNAAVEVWDVESRERVYTFRFRDTDSFDSQKAMMEESARKAVRELRRNNALGNLTRR